ncbi:MAG TPA: NADH oxidase [Desulfobacterales bacterium]|nr:NADH oxidase [Desulfobacterales bacterium]
MSNYKKLFSPLQVGPLTLRNRISYSPTLTGFATVDGEVSRLMLDYYNRLAKGGAGMVYIGSVSVDWPTSRNNYCVLRADDNRFIFGLNKLAETIQKNGAAAVLQVHHAGRFGKVDEPVGPTELPGMFMEGKMTKNVRALKTVEVEGLVEKFAQAALRARQAGFDMVDIHGGTGYLIQEFYSPHTNKRMDKYGGSFENRIRFPLEIVERTRELCGEDYPLSFTLIADELTPDGSGTPLSEGIALAKRLEQAGINIIICRAGTYETMCLGEGVLAMRSPAGVTLPITAAVKKEIGIPVASFAKIHDPEFMEKILEEGKADLIHTARALIADPELPKKTKAGRVEDVRRCISCFMCHERFNNARYMGCAVNASMGLEDTECSLEKVREPKKVVVIGGGPGGMEAARIAALRGHKVTLFEKDKELGGQLIFAALGLGKEVYKTKVIDWLKLQCEKAGVEIILNKEATAKDIEKIKPDAVVVATGVSFPKPPIPGVDGKNVCSFSDVLMKKVNLSGKEVVVIGGSDIGTEVADFLAETGSKVTVIRRKPEIGAELVFTEKAYIMQKFVEYKVALRPGLAAQEITRDGVVVMDKKWRKSLIKADAVVLALGGASNASLAEALDGKVPEIHVVGDAKNPRKLYTAIQEGFYAGRRV